MIINVRGTHGAGKTWVVRQVLDRIHNEHKLVPEEIWSMHHSLKRKSDLLMGYVYPMNPPLTVLGHYGEDLACGGCDRIKSNAAIVDLVRMGVEYGNVLFEGIIPSGAWRDYYAIAQDVPDYRFIFLDTPLEVCIERTIQRRHDKGNFKPFREHNLIDHMKRKDRYIKKCRLLDLPHWVVNTEEAVRLIRDWLHV